MPRQAQPPDEAIASGGYLAGGPISTRLDIRISDVTPPNQQKAMGASMESVGASELRPCLCFLCLRSVRQYMGLPFKIHPQDPSVHRPKAQLWWQQWIYAIIITHQELSRRRQAPRANGIDHNSNGSVRALTLTRKILQRIARK